MECREGKTRLISFPVGTVSPPEEAVNGLPGYIRGEAEYLGSMRKEGKWRDYWRVIWEGKTQYVFTERR